MTIRSTPTLASVQPSDGITLLSQPNFNSHIASIEYGIPREQDLTPHSQAHFSSN